MMDELKQDNFHFRALFENMSGGVAVFRASADGQDFYFAAYNRAAEEIDHIRREDLIGRSIVEVFPGVMEMGLLDAFRRVWKSGVAEQLPARLYHDDRISGWREYYIYKLPDGAIVAIYEDVTERRQAEEAQQRLNRALRLLSDCNTTLVHAQEEASLLNEVCRLIVEKGGYRMAWVGYAQQDDVRSVRPVAQAGHDDGYLENINVSWADNERGKGPTGTAIRTGVTSVNQNCLTNPVMAPWRDASIQRGYHSSISLPLNAQKSMLGALTIYSSDPGAFNPEEVQLLEELAGDLTFGIETLRTRAEHQAAEEKLIFMAHHDTLTRLPNRLLLHDRYSQAAAGALREQTGLAMLILDLDNFKQVNDSFGHNRGDQLLVQVVRRLQACIRQTDTVSRDGGDEFVILLPGANDLTDIGGIAHKIVDSFAEPFEIDGYLLNTSVSIGISLFPHDGQDFDALLKKADTALFHAKDSGRNTYRFFAEQMNIDALDQMHLQSQLRNAVRNREFVLHYQPQFDAASGRIIGAEALVRWQHPEMGLVPPGRFIPLAERSGVIIQIGEWVLEEACRQAQSWRESGHPVVMAVNLSALQFKRGNILETVTGALEKSGLPAGLLELELTESILLQDVEVVVETLRGMKAMGLKLSIDDFGTGYSSLSYLKRLAVDKLKIDQSFVRDLAVDPDDAAIVKAIIQLGHTLQLTVIAEGVETDGQLAYLRNYGCDEVQGYLFSRPVPAEEFFALFPRPDSTAAQENSPLI